MEMIKNKLDDLILDNKDIFRKELKKVIKPKFDGLEKPEKYKNILLNTIKQSKRPNLLRQAQLVSAATEYLESKKNKSLIISAEMGTGKTQIGINISLSNRLKPVWMIICPPHLVDTWIDELAKNYRNPQEYKAIVIKRYDDIAKYSKRNLWNDGIKYYFIITRERLKLSYPKDVAVNIARKYITVDKILDGETVMVNKLVKVAKCPDCGITLVEGTQDSINLKEVPLKCECGAVLRQPSKECSPKMRTRESVADFIFKNFTKGSYNVILDEMHEYKGGNTGQGNAMGRLISNARKTIGLTGTLMNGFASSLFYLLYRMNPNLMNKRLGFDYTDVKKFVSTYGAHEESFDAREVTAEGVVTRMGRRIDIKERAKVSPYMLSVLLDMTIFLKLEEIKMPNNLQLPPYEEVVDLVEMEVELKRPYISYLADITSQIKLDKRLLGNLATDAIAIPDMPFIPRSAQNKCFYNPKTTRKNFGLTNKEKRLIENVRGELEQGRDCLVYINFSRQQVATDIQDILSTAFPDKTIKFLPSTVSPVKRKQWIAKNPCDVLICNPELVKTGLTLLNFVTIIFYETTYNVFTLKQASRRSWRIGQKKDIKVIFMAYANTPQHKALELIGTKISAANSLEGKLSGDDDLSSIGNDEDNIQLALAKSILSGQSTSKNIEMTSIKDFGADRDFNAFELYYQKLLDEDSKSRKLEESKKVIQAELIETATKNEETGISVHDGHGGNWGGGLADLFELSDNNSNISICSMPIPDDNYGFKEGDTVLVENGEIAVFKKSPANGQLYTVLSNGQPIFLNSFTASKFSLDLNKSETIGLPIENEVSYVAIIGKGKKAKKVKVNSANNLFDEIPEADKATGVQLAFAF